MNEKNTNTILEALAETIENLRTKVMILEYENGKLKEELDLFKAPTQEVKKDA